jgi:hypothetical protein
MKAITPVRVCSFAINGNKNSQRAHCKLAVTARCRIDLFKTGEKRHCAMPSLAEVEEEQAAGIL